jgi:hypothetical protein
VNWLRNPSVWLLDLPLALAGIPPEVYLAAGVINQVYQFLLHTQLVGKLRPLGWVLVTPSHHRVHHGTNPIYRDKNYGGIFIVWDRLFGSFAPETEAPVYGLVKPLQSDNPLWAHVHGWVELARELRAQTRWRDRLGVLLRNPGWRPGDANKWSASDRFPTPRQVAFAPTVLTPGLVYVGLQCAALGVATLALLLDLGGMTVLARAATYASALTSVAMWQGLMLGRRPVVKREAWRLGALALAALSLAAAHALSPAAAAIVMAYAVLGAALLRQVLKASLETDVVEPAVRPLAELGTPVARVEGRR